jgi:hypothetical protein
MTDAQHVASKPMRKPLMDWRPPVGTKASVSAIPPNPVVIQIDGIDYGLAHPAVPPIWTNFVIQTDATPVTGGGSGARRAHPGDCWYPVRLLVRRRRSGAQRPLDVLPARPAETPSVCKARSSFRCLPPCPARCSVPSRPMICVGASTGAEQATPAPQQCGTVSRRRKDHSDQGCQWCLHRRSKT